MATSQDAIVPDQTSENQVPEWMLASQGIKLLINNKSEEAVTLFLNYPDSLVMFAGYSFAIFMDALMTFEEDKLILAISTLKEVEKKCATENGWLKSLTSRVFGAADSNYKNPKSLADQLETQIMLADSQVCIAILTFLQQDITGYFKGGWVLRKAWKVYQRVYKDILQLYEENVGELHLPDAAQISMTPTNEDNLTEWEIPDNQINGYSSPKLSHSQSANIFQSRSIDPSNNRSAIVKKSSSIHSALSGQVASTAGQSFWSAKFSPFYKSSSLSFSSYLSNSLHMFSSQERITRTAPIEKETIIRLMGAVSFGYGLFQLGISLLPPSLMKLINMLGFGANRQNGIACLMYARLGVDMRAPLACLSLLWYHTIVRPFYAIDGSNVEAGVEAALQLLRESEEDYKDSALFLFFRGRAFRLNSDIPAALEAFQQAVENATQREMKILCLHEVAWCHIIELDYCQAETRLIYLKSASRWSRAFYSYLGAICAGSCDTITNLQIFEELQASVQSAPKGSQLDEFLAKRSKRCPSNREQIARCKQIYWRLLVFELLYLWNALPSCSFRGIDQIIQDCDKVSSELDEPMVGISLLIAGCSLNIRNRFAEGILKLKKCLQSRQNISPTADDAHVSAFAQFELGSVLIKVPETREEGKRLLQGMHQYTHFDFDQRLNLRVHSLLKQL